jgi:L-rhamnose mutarotase
MERAAFLLKVRPDRLEEYRRQHESVWPEMLEALRRNGWRNYSLFTTEDGHLFGYVEADESFQKSVEGMSKEDINLRWQELMAPSFENLAGLPDQSMVQLEHIFFLE